MRQWINIFENVSGASYDDSDPIISKYAEGLCYALAIAHNRRFGWPIYVLGADEDDYKAGDEIGFFHGMVMHPTGLIIDITGPHKPNDFEDNWGEAILKIGNETDLLKHLGDYMKNQTLEGVEDANATIDSFLIPKYPDLYKPSIIKEADMFDELRDYNTHQMQLRTYYADAIKTYPMVTLASFRWKHGNAHIVVMKHQQNKGFQRLFIITDEGDCLGGINLTTIDHHELRINFSIVFEEYRGAGLGYLAYKALLDEGYAISSDTSLSNNAITLWKRLWNDPSLEHGVYQFRAGATPLYIGSDVFDDVFDHKDSYIKVEKR